MDVSSITVSRDFQSNWLTCNNIIEKHRPCTHVSVKKAVYGEENTEATELDE